MRVDVKKWGKSAAVRIPAALMSAADFRVDDTVDIRAEGGRVVMELIREPDYDIDQLLDRITPENLHHAISFGCAEGKEGL
ncbi:AbrB/MazE/SpoVT family DNA-binding domain-containing protein [Segnochrobactrum spirostomi]|uniref:AbrB/MazE/SpoVT family DNA-binding domain-containing protein n=1 Tax=Segnochrobactrum spirostomi TaxID=2608987 RepID=A0A6A7Y4D4_9HYPH|nr:AbrB/MazE/SpoVT family DNA-binding domain-containing protein [Segnochrobactrum spirostomi]MQT13078.1 AbrB/MazE/SpoVT family DNA-binding domain-containing protein [Segnochrobactrum spirostomi]